MQFDQYPVPSRWVQRFRQSAPVQSNFQEAAWQVPKRNVSVSIPN